MIEKVEFETEDLKAGDIITLSRPERGEVARWLIAEIDGPVAKTIILLDRTGNRWTGNLMSFAKEELDTKRWRKLV